MRWLGVRGGRVLACNGFARGNGPVVAGRALPLWPQLYPSIEKATTVELICVYSTKALSAWDNPQ